MTIKTNLSEIRKSIDDICKNVNRDPSSVKLIAVSKTKPASMVVDAYNTGQFDFGENNVMEAKSKFEELTDMNINWHIIGSLQTNKIKYITNFCHLLHSLDRASLADKLNDRLEFENKDMNCLIQINTSGENTKSGISPEKAIEFAEYVSKKPRIKVKGLMTIAENSEDETAIRNNFQNLRQLFEKIKNMNLENFDMKELSMGMSGDYKIAIEEGSTMLRIGSSIFGGRN